MINLFPKVAARQKLSEGQHEYHLVVDNIRPLDYEIYAVNKIYGSADGQRDDQTFRPFWSTGAAMQATTGPTFPCAGNNACSLSTPCVTAPAPATLARRSLSRWWMSSMHRQENLRYISAEVLCTSRDLPLMLQQELGQFIMADSMPVKSLTLRKGPTPPRPALAEGFSTAVDQPATDELPQPDGQ